MSTPTTPADPAAKKPKRTAIVWDEDNLKGNEKYFEENPVTMRINEPKTPFEPTRDWDLEEAQEDTWKSDANSVARETKVVITQGYLGDTSSPVVEAPPLKVGKGPLSIVTEGPGQREVLTEFISGTAEHDAVFHGMRKAVLGDEGRRFRELMKNMPKDDDDEE